MKIILFLILFFIWILVGSILSLIDKPPYHLSFKKYCWLYILSYIIIHQRVISFFLSQNLDFTLFLGNIWLQSM